MFKAAVQPSSILKAEETEAAWADFGRAVSKNIHNPDFVTVLANAGLKSKSTREMLGYIRAFILTGAKP
jgi:hypothetical protein